MGLSVHLWGIRGSLPAPHTPEQVHHKLVETLRLFDTKRSEIKDLDRFAENLPIDLGRGFGGHTACIEVTSPKARLVLDAGSGIRCLGEKLMLEASGAGRGVVHILMTHFHWDHLIGLPFFVPIFVPGNTIHFYAVQDDLEDNIRRVFRKPNFPVEFDRLPSKIIFHKIEARQPLRFEDITVTPYQLDHPDPCWGYRMEHAGKVFSHCVDSECRRVTREAMGPDLPLYQNVDLMTFDAQYTFLEAAERINWGHASGPIGVDIGMREHVKKMLFIHHDPAAPDAKIMEAERQTREYYESALAAARAQNRPVFELDWMFAREGMKFQL
jgi:phosphoribosyl 1,2-cyclic phosphodiesterase